MNLTCHDTHHIAQISTYSSFFILGFLTSFHCVGMCGPISTLFISNKKSAVFESLYYNLSRLISYIIVGSILYVLGANIFNEKAKFISALLLVTFLIFNSLFRLVSMPLKVKKLYFRVQSKILSIFPEHFQGIVLGLLSGLFPCGLLYTAYAAALTTKNISIAIISLAVFALGTMPSLFAFNVLGVNFFKSMPYKVQQYIYHGLASISLIFIIIMNFMM